MLLTIATTLRVYNKLIKRINGDCKVASLGQITDALFNVGGQYRRNM